MDLILNSKKAVTLSLDQDTLKMLGEVGTVSTTTAQRCEDSGNVIEQAFSDFVKGIARYLGEKKREELEDSQKRETFTARMLNTVAYFRFNLLSFNAVFKGIILRRKSIEMLAAAMFDLTLEGAFAWLGNWRQAKNAQGNDEAIKSVQKAAEKKYFSDVINDFIGRVEIEIRNAERWFHEAEAAFSEASEGYKTARQNAKFFENKILNPPKGTTEQQLLEWYEKWFKADSDSIALLERKAFLDKRRIIARKQLDGKNVVKRNLESLRAPGTDIQQAWEKSFGPGGSGEQLWDGIKADCQEQLGNLASYYGSQLDIMRNRINTLPPQCRADAQANIDKIQNLISNLQKLDAKEAFYLEASKDMTGMAAQEVDSRFKSDNDRALAEAKVQTEKLKELSRKQEEIERQNSNILYRLWRGFWDFLYWIGDCIGSALSAIGSLIPDWVFTAGKYLLLVVTVVTAIWFWWITLLVGAMFLALFLLMELFQLIAWLVAYLGRWRSATYLESNYQKSGQDLMVQRGVPYSHFYGEAQEDTIQQIVYDANPDNFPDTAIQDKVAATQLQIDLKAKVQQQCTETAETHKKDYRSVVISLCQEALGIERFYNDNSIVREQISEIRSVMADILVIMKDYEREFMRANDGFVEFADRKAGDLLAGDENLTWASLANWLNLFGTQVNLLLNGICAVLARWWPAGIAAVLPTLGTASLCIAATRVIICTLLVTPCVTAFAGDFMAMQGVAFKRMIKEETDTPLPALAPSAGGGIPNAYAK